MLAPFNSALGGGAGWRRPPPPPPPPGPGTARKTSRTRYGRFRSLFWSRRDAHGGEEYEAPENRRVQGPGGSKCAARWRLACGRTPEQTPCLSWRGSPAQDTHRPDRIPGCHEAPVHRRDRAGGDEGSGVARRRTRREGDLARREDIGARRNCRRHGNLDVRGAKPLPTLRKVEGFRQPVFRPLFLQSVRTDTCDHPPGCAPLVTAPPSEGDTPPSEV